MDFRHFKKKLFLSLIVGMMVFAGLSMYSDFNHLIGVFVHFNYRYLPVILLLAPMNYVLRYIKWTYYLNLIDARVPSKDRFLIFISGLCMTVTPGKIGELLKSYLLKERAGIPISSTAPLVMGERFTDGISMLLLAGIGALSYDYGRKVLGIVLLAMVAFIVFVQSPPLVHSVLNLLKRIKGIAPFGAAIENFYEKIYMLLRWRPLLFAMVIGVVSWFFEGLVIYFTVKAMGMDFPLLASIFTVSFSSIIGALSMMPGGLFAAEGSILGLLMMMKLPREMAVAATMITRFSTLWLGVLIGILGLLAVQGTLWKAEEIR
ncbi:lysylphosphatidylglycerol synthase transmembrane domain-containing protein [Thermotalea metallivorans]|uniref:Phosphatidylglycerol lysyltransferase n=1 Tax=Thermotalea metallivorans TaxID=520762 RepID=A0A140L6Q1_9FIRM|nr:lysylphosphatidylglycerol synthase transmembrane domain-containing protein [Thermotalea metallivorans]KXG76226.1 hypothetical protein AN619_11830 [Thermotalea metallivorans]